MITAQQIANQARAIGLDAEGTDYYDDDLHIIPAINAAVRWLMSVASVAFSQKRMSEEHFKDVIALKVFQTSSLSRIAISQEVYSILNVLPYPTCLPNSNPELAGNEYDSRDMSSSRHFVSAEYSAKRYSFEQYNHFKKNPFKPGNTFQSSTLGELTTFSYYSPLLYGQYSSNTDASYIEISPALNRKLCAVTYLKTQFEIDSLQAELNFNENFINILAFKVTSFLTLKQGDFTTIHNVSEKEVLTLLSAIS